jgi:hypothetical protein
MEDDAGPVQKLNYQLPVYHRSAVVADLSRVGVLLCFGHAQGIDFKKEIKLRLALKTCLVRCDFECYKRL